MSWPGPVSNIILWTGPFFQKIPIGVHQVRLPKQNSVLLTVIKAAAQKFLTALISNSQDRSWRNCKCPFIPFLSQQQIVYMKGYSLIIYVWKESEKHPQTDSSPLPLLLLMPWEASLRTLQCSHQLLAEEHRDIDMHTILSHAGCAGRTPPPPQPPLTTAHCAFITRSAQLYSNLYIIYK